MKEILEYLYWKQRQERGQNGQQMHFRIKKPFFKEKEIRFWHLGHFLFMTL